MKTGRPLEFDPEIALARAMETFWTKGYAATSTADLMAAMGISKSSLYQTFDSKRELFIRSLEYYCQHSIERQRRKLAGAEPGKQFLIELFRGFIDPNREGVPKGCLLVNTACEFGGNDKELSSFIENRLEKSRQVFQQAIETAQAAGEIPGHKDARDLSGFLMVNSFGLRAMGKLNIDRSILEPVVDQVLSQLD